MDDEDISQSEKLTLWYDYIDWLEQNCPEGGDNSIIAEAVETCIEQFHDVQEFKQDERLFNIFMKFKRFCGEPLEIFSFMYANSISTLIASFYLRWSWQYDIRLNIKKANEIIETGIKNRASPIDSLEQARDQLQYRLFKAVMSGESDQFEQNTTDDTGPNANAIMEQAGIRKALQSLKMTKLKNDQAKVSINRTGPAVDQVNVGGLKSQTKIVNGIKVAVKSKPKLTSRKPGENAAPLDVFADENEDTVGPLKTILPRPIPTSQRVSSVGKVGRENEIVSDKITEARSGLSRRPNRPRARPTTTAPKTKPTFAIFEDDCDKK